MYNCYFSWLQTKGGTKSKKFCYPHYTEDVVHCFIIIYHSHIYLKSYTILYDVFSFEISLY